MEAIDNETGEVVERPVTALAKVQPGGSRLLALDSMDEAEFSARLSLLRTSQERMRRIQRELLVPDEDYGEIPGTAIGKPGDKGYKPGKPTLLKAGAEKLLKFYGLVPTFEIDRTYGDGVTSPPLHVAVRCLVHVGDASGPVYGQGDGTCSTWERKYRYRPARKACPACQAQALIRTKKGTPQEQWWCVPDKGGCSANYPKDAPEIVEQVTGDIENPDPLDLDNTVVKMAVKRALVAAALLVTATSGLFTQDLDDVERPEAPRPAPSTTKRQVDADALEFAVRPILDVFRKAETVAEFDVLAEQERKGSRVAALDDGAKKYLSAQAGKMRKALEAMAPAAPIVEPPAAAAKRSELREALSAPEPAREPGEDDGPPPDEMAGLALIDVLRTAKTATVAEKLWAKVQATPTFKAAHEGARAVAKREAEGIIADLQARHGEGQ